MEAFRLVQHRAVQHLIRARPQRQTLRVTLPTLQQSLRTRSTAFSRGFHTQRPRPSRFADIFRKTSRTFRRQNTTTTSPNQKLSLSQRLKKLSREYGWSALGVYLLLSALDFPFCFMAVRLLGTDRIGHWEHVIMSYIKGAIQWPMSEEGQAKVEGASKMAKDFAKEQLEAGDKRVLELDGQGEYAVEDHGYREAEKANRGEDASIWTQLALAYAIHKSFIFIRVPLTAAVTPKVVKTLRGWGWNIGKMPKRKAGSDSLPGVNTKGSGVKPDN